jgi:hypothetical protein
MQTLSHQMPSDQPPYPMTDFCKGIGTNNGPYARAKKASGLGGWYQTQFGPMARQRSANGAPKHSTDACVLPTRNSEEPIFLVEISEPYFLFSR